MILPALTLIAATATAEPPPEQPATPVQTPEVDAAAPRTTLFTAACPRWELTDTEEARRAEASKAIERANDLFRAGKHDEALAAIDLAECHWPDRDYDFMRGTIHQSRGDCDKAVVAFAEFIVQDPPAVDARAARTQVRACDGLRSAVPPRPALVELPAPAPEPPPPQKHWSRDVAGGVLLGVGAAGLAAGAAILITSRVQGDRTATDYSDFTDRTERTRALRVGGTVAVVASSALITGAIIRYALIARRNRHARRTRHAKRE